MEHPFQNEDDAGAPTNRWRQPGAFSYPSSSRHSSLRSLRPYVKRLQNFPALQSSCLSFAFLATFILFLRAALLGQKRKISKLDSSASTASTNKSGTVVSFCFRVFRLFRSLSRHPCERVRTPTDDFGRFRLTKDQ